MLRPSFLAALAAACTLTPAFAAPPSVAGCDIFPANNVWNTPVDTLAVHPLSATWVNTMGATRALHPDFGSFLDKPTNMEPFGIPFVAVPQSQGTVPVTFDYADESDPGPYPIPPNAPIEGVGPPNVDGDRHVLVLQQGWCRLFEMFYAFPQGGGTSWTAGSGAVFDLASNALRTEGWTSADAAGLSIFAGLVRRDEAMAGDIRHAIRLTAPQTRKQHIWPATHDASSLTDVAYPPMGARFRLKASFNEAGYSGPALAVIKALKKYGMILADNGSAWYISGEHNPNWDDNLINPLKNLRGSDFEAVQTAPMVISPTSAESFQPPPRIGFREVASGLNRPVDLGIPNDGSDRVFVLEQGGTIRLIKNGVLQPGVALDITARVESGGERGLLGIALDPRWHFNHRLFLYYNKPGGDIQVSSFLANPANDGDTIDPSSESPILSIPHSQFGNHNGGKLAFGRDGYLYVGVGDGGGSGDPNGNAQNPGVLLGKILRIDVRGPSGYVVPPDNPFGTPVWAMGVRNPWRFSFDRETGDFYLGDVGQNAREEVDFLAAGSGAGVNFGWNILEGDNCFTGCVPPGNYRPPVLTYGRDALGGQSVTGGYVYRGRRSAALQGYYVFSDFVSNNMWAATHEGATWTMFPITDVGGVLNVAAFAEDYQGELWLASFGNGKVFVMEPPGPGLPLLPPPVFASPTRFDFDLDGKADVLWQHTDGSTAMWTMNGTTQTGGARLLTAGSGWTAKHVGDFNGDNRADILWEHTDGTTAIWLMQGTQQVGGAKLLNAGSGWSAVALADFNGDGKSDILWRHTDGTYALWLMNGATQVGGARLLTAGSGWTFQATGDFNGDGRADILWQHTDGRTAMWLMNGSVQVGGALLLTAGSPWTAKVAGDFNGDGNADILWQHADGTVAMWLMQGTAQVGGARLLTAGSGWSPVATGRFDANGTDDIVWARTDGAVATWLMQGTAQVGGALLTAAGTGYTFKRIADFNGDLRGDVLMQKADGSSRMWLVNGSTFTAGDIIAAGSGWSVAPAR